MQYENSTGINLAMAIWLVNDNYDYNPDPNYISATSLLKPIRATVLTKLNDLSDLKMDISSLIKSRAGSAIHDAAELAWQNPDTVKLACELVDIPSDQADKLVHNPKTVAKGQIPVYTEQRKVKEINGYKIGGKFDLVLNGELHDYKTTGVYTYIKDSKADDYIKQGSIYCWLNPDIITSDILTIDYYFTDWKKYETYKEGYPEYPIMNKQYPLMSLEDTEKFILSKLEKISYYKQHPDKLPQCTDEELWKEPSEYKYYSKPGAQRATKNFKQDAAGAYAMQAQKGGEVRIAPSVAKACNYCNARPFCTQANELQIAGLLQDV